MYFPVANDGIFFIEDSLAKIKRGDVTKKITYVVSTNSYEGGFLFDGFMSFLGLTEDNLTIESFQNLLEMTQFGNSLE
jgi:hypothetical protein